MLVDFINKVQIFISLAIFLILSFIASTKIKENSIQNDQNTAGDKAAQKQNMKLKQAFEKSDEQDAYLAGMATAAVAGGADGSAGSSSGKLNELQKKVLLKYKKYKAKKKRPTFTEFCYPKSYQVQPHQEFLGEFMKPDESKSQRKANNSMLAFHAIGAGKTCAAIQVAERWTSRTKPLVILPASLIGGFRSELRSPCAGNKYIDASDRRILAELSPTDDRYKKVIDASDKLIDKNYHIMSYNKFLTHGADIQSDIIIIDEVQNVCNPNGSFFKALHTWITSHKNASVLLMSGTPFFDTPRDITGIAMLLRLRDDTDLIESKDISTLFNGHVSFFGGAPDYVYPDTTIKVVHCAMSSFQTKWYKSEVEKELMKNQNLRSVEISNDFYIKSRQRANIVFPNGLSGEQGLASFKNANITNGLASYSIKYAKIVRRLKKGYLSFIYSNFTGSYGIGALCKILDAFGWKDFDTHGPGKRRYALWTGDESMTQKNKLREVFNAKSNDDGSQIQIVIGSPAIKEGVSLFRVKHVHVVEPYWNHSRLEQIYGRARRYCSHKTLPREERWLKIYLYCSVAAKAKNNKWTPDTSIDMTMLDIADQKREVAEQYIKELRRVAVDRGLFY